ncbi:MAG TPA: SEC-C metal-binding domain-containing protein [Bdellovibrionota bacterium]|nr:SEC-C metal-binding domain-containing protein [Bdellovibrionota bacterium]
MSDRIRTTEEVLADIRNLVGSPGYVYPLLLIIFEDFHIDPENLHKINYWERLNVNEASLLVGLLIQKSIDFTPPESFDSLFEAKQKTRELLQELHRSFNKPFMEKLRKAIPEGQEQTPSGSFQDVFGQGDMLVEPIFYSGTGVYDFQYLDFLPKKYQYDHEWLKAKRGFVFAEVVEIFKRTKELLQRNSERVHLYVSRGLEQAKEKARKSYKGKDFEADFQQVVKMAELHQYADLFFDDTLVGLDPKTEEFRAAAHRAFYRNLINLFTIEKSKLLKLSGGDYFIRNFSICPGDPLCSRFAGIGAYNVASTQPLIELDNDRLLLPIPFVLSEAIYEAPFYWMMGDDSYKNTASDNRGDAGEEIVFQFLSKVFGRNAYRRVLVKTGNAQTETDVDVLCLLGSKALCVQVKSKKLTELSRRGDNESLKNDFQKAVQDAYEQAWIARQKILDKTSKFFDENGEIRLSEGIDDVYMLVVTTENYPSLTHQVHTLLKLKENSPSPLAFTAFDLEMVTHYLTDPYDLLYYIRQRIKLIDYFQGGEEMTFLGYHLSRKLWREEEADWVLLDTCWAQAIDRNYYPFKAGLKVSDEGDSIKARWKDEKFNLLCDAIKTLSGDKVTDIIFHLYDLSGDFRTRLAQLIQERKKKTWADNKFHSVAIPPDDKYEPRFGITYFSSETDSLKEVENRLHVLCSLRKYQSRADAWLGLGSIKSSLAPFDFIMYNSTPWTHDEFLEEGCKHLPALVKSTQVNLSPVKATNKVGRNEPCPCGSGKKYKKCCLLR